MNTAQSTYPMLFSAQDRCPGLEAAIDKAVAAHAAGSIPNPRFKELKDTISRAVETAFNKVTGKYTHRGAYKNLPEEVYKFEYMNFGIIYPHMVPGKAKLLRETKLDHPMITELRALAEELLPLVEMLDALKGMAKKRQPAVQENLKEKYSAPEVSGTATAKVRDLLIQITEETKLALEASIATWTTGCVNHYLAMQTKAIAKGKELSLYDHFCPDGLDGHLVSLVSKFVDGGYSGIVGTLKTDAAALIAAYAAKVAEETRDNFIYKNLSKIASVVEAKGNYKSGEIVSHSISLSSLEGALRFNFDDGSSFVVNNSVVYVTNSFNTSFQRFPLTFHGVILPNGKRMPRPSQERMNEIFVVS